MKSEYWCFLLNTHRFNHGEYIPLLKMTFRSDSKFPRGVGHTSVDKFVRGVGWHAEVSQGYPQGVTYLVLAGLWPKTG